MKLPKDFLDKVRAQGASTLDQEWAAGLEFYEGSDPLAILGLHVGLANTGSALRAWFSQASDIQLDSVSHLALTALLELTMRCNLFKENE